jgi:hypothetical protein
MANDDRMFQNKSLTVHYFARLISDGDVDAQFYYKIFLLDTDGVD